VWGRGEGRTFIAPRGRPIHQVDEPSLRARIRQLLAEGRLPRRGQDRTWAGPGTGGACAACGAPIGVAETEYELEYQETAPDSGVYRFHRLCLVAWELERQSA
jgi:hypothetical protein